MKCYNDLAKLYDELIYEDINYKVWANVILEEMKKYNISFNSYLDLACGTGNMMRELAGSFRKNRGIDLSQDMLCIAEDKLREIGVNAKFACLDISDFSLREKFDLITCCLDSTNYLLEEEDIVGYFESVYNVLEDDGLFVFDINTEYKLRNVLGNNTFTYDNEEIFYVWENSIEDDIVDMYLTFFIKEGSMYNRFDENHTERIYSVKLLEELLDEVGFEVIKKCDRYEFEVKENSERIAFFVRKK